MRQGPQTYAVAVGPGHPLVTQVCVPGARYGISIPDILLVQALQLPDLHAPLGPALRAEEMRLALGVGMAAEGVAVAEAGFGEWWGLQQG